MTKIFPYRIVERQETGILFNILSTVFGLVISIVITAGLIVLSGSSAKTVLFAIAKGAFGDLSSFFDTLLKATPILLTGLATSIAFRAKVWNIGQEGQLYAGAMSVSLVVLVLQGFQLPGIVYIPLLILASFIGGAIWGGIPGILKAKYNVNEIIVTVMLNYVILYLCTFLLGGVWQEPGSYYYNTIRFPTSTFLPLLFNSRLHMGFIVALVLSYGVYFLLWKMKLGYEIRAIGNNPVASRYKGIKTNRIILTVMLLSGGVAGLAGGIEILGIHHRLVYGFSSSFGFTGILIALLGRLHPFGVILAAIFFGALQNGASAMQIYSDVPRELVTLIMGLIIILLLFSQAVFKYRIRRIENVG